MAGYKLEIVFRTDLGKKLIYAANLLNVRPEQLAFFWILENLKSIKIPKKINKSNNNKE